MCFNIFLQLQLSLPAEDLNDQRIDNICRNQSVLYYDCTNFFFEIEQEVIRDFDCLKFYILFRCRTWIKDKPPVQWYQ